MLVVINKIGIGCTPAYSWGIVKVVGHTHTNIEIIMFSGGKKLLPCTFSQLDTPMHLHLTWIPEGWGPTQGVQNIIYCKQTLRKTCCKGCLGKQLGIIKCGTCGVSIYLTTIYFIMGVNTIWLSSISSTFFAWTWISNCGDNLVSRNTVNGIYIYYWCSFTFIQNSQTNIQTIPLLFSNY